MNLSMSILYRWSLNQPSSTISGSLFLGVRDLGLKTEVNEAIAIWVPALTFATNLPAPFDRRPISFLVFVLPTNIYTDDFHIILDTSCQFELQQSFCSPHCTAAHPCDTSVLPFWSLYPFPSFRFFFSALVVYCLPRLVSGCPSLFTLRGKDFSCAWRRLSLKICLNS